MSSLSSAIAPTATAGVAYDGYLTDGARLFRVVAAVNPDPRFGFARLEDCQTLEVRRYEADELSGMHLRPVEQASA
jgi:hypothetical protein